MIIRIYQKAEEGQGKVRTRANHLDQRHHAVFLMVNGERVCDDVLVQLQPLGMTQAVFDELEEGGYIRPHLASNTTVKAVSTDEPTPTPVSASAVPAIPSKEPVAEGYQHLYRPCTEVISRYLGLRGCLLGMKVEKAGNVAELVALHNTLEATLSKTRGEPGTNNVIAQLDLLVDEAAGQAHTVGQ